MKKELQVAINERVKFLYESLLKNRVVQNQTDFATRVGLEQSSLNSIINNKRKLPAAKAIKISKEFGVNLDWILEGKGNLNITNGNKDEKFIITNSPQVGHQPELKTQEEIQSRVDYYKGQVDLLKELLREKEIRQPKAERTEITVPLEVRDLVDRDSMNKIERFLGDNIYKASICVSDKFGKIEYVNDEFTNQTGYTIADIKGKSPGDLLQGDDTDKAAKKEMRDALINRTYYEGEVLNYNKSGEPIKCKLIFSPIKIKGAEKFISLAVFSKVNVFIKV